MKIKANESTYYKNQSAAIEITEYFVFRFTKMLNCALVKYMTTSRLAVLHCSHQTKMCKINNQNGTITACHSHSVILVYVNTSKQVK